MADVDQPLETRPDSNVVNPNNAGLTTRKKAIYAAVTLVAVGVVVAVIVIAVYFISGKNDEIGGVSQGPQDQNNTTANVPRPQDQDKTTANVPSFEVCQTAECVNVARFMKSLMDESVSPCEDFYQFSCGNFKTNYQLAEGISIRTIVATAVEEIVRSLLEAPDKKDQEPYVTKAKNFYKSCTDVSQIDQLNKKPILKLLKDLGGWPLVNDWKEENFDLNKLLHNDLILGVQSLIHVYSEVDKEKTTQNTLYVNSAYFDPKNTRNNKEWKKYIYDVANLIGFSNAASVEKDLDDMTVLHESLMNISDRRPRSFEDHEYNKMTLQKFSNENSISDFLDMGALIKGLMSESGVAISDDDQVINEDSNFFKKLKVVLTNTDKKTITNYIIFGTIDWYITMFPTDFRKLENDLRWNDARKIFCVDKANRLIGKATGRMYVDQSFPPQAKDQVNEMVDYIQNTFNDHLSGLAWMDEDTKKIAIEKNKAISRGVGYPEEVMNDTYLNNLYKGITVTNQDALENRLSLEKHRFKESMKKYGKPIDKKIWPLDKNLLQDRGSFNQLRNQIFSPAGSLNPPLFYNKYPNYVNYGGIGNMIGHEFIHAFDTKGRHFDKNGLKTDWWTQETNEKFLEKAQCLIDQYDKMTYNVYGVYSVNVNGTRTLKENIADNGRIKISYKAYKAWEKAQGKPEPRLPGLDYTNDQVFFINSAQIWCSVLTDEELYFIIERRAQSPDDARARGPIANSPHFGELFKCAKGTKMNPVSKCNVW